MEKLLNLREVCELTGLGKSTIYELMQVDRFPRPIRIGFRAVRWRQADLRGFIEELSASR